MAKIEKDTKQTENEPEVEIMGRKITEDDRYNWRHQHHHSIVWGVFLIFAGVLLLLNTLEIVPWNVWNNIWQFWPLLLVLIGFQIILGFSRVSRIIVSLISIVLLGLVFLEAVREVSPSLTTQLPSDIVRVLDYWQNIKR